MAFLKGPQPVHSDVTEMYRSLYFKVFETLKTNIEQRFDQKGFQIAMDLENLLFKSALGQDCKEEFRSVKKFYGSDLNPELLQTQLLTYTAKFKEFKTENIMLEDVKQFMRQPGYAQLLSEVSTVLQLLLILPASNGGAERGFSGLKRTKNYLRNSMKQKRLNHLMVINIHKDIAKQKLDLKAVANEFVSKGIDRRKSDFGTFE